MDYKKIAQDILDHVGGKQNVKSLTHCITRLRFVLNDSNKADKNVVSRLEGVISVVTAGGQFQVVCGNKVTKIYDAMVELLGGELGGSVDIPQEKQKLINVITQKLSEIFTPLVPAIAAAGLIKGLLAAAAKVPGFDTANSTYIIMNTASNVIFFFMPIFLAYTAAKAFKCSPIISMMLGGLLCHPTIDKLVQDVATPSSIFGLPVMKMAFTVGESTRIFAYTESVIPIVLGVLVLSWLEKFLKKHVPDIVQLIMVPGLSLIIMVPVMLVVVGPVGIYVGYLVQALYTSLYSTSPLMGGIIVGGLWGVCVIFGAHRALLPIGLNDVALTGTNTLMCFAGSANFAQAGASLGVFLKSKSAGLKQVAASATISAWLVGVTEPAIYGCNLRLKRPMICAIISGALGGAIMGVGKAINTGFANNGILTIMSYYGEGTSFNQFMSYIAGICVAFFGGALLTYLVGFEDDPVKPAEAAVAETAAAVTPAAPVVPEKIQKTEIGAPVAGRCINLSEIPDETFASGVMGQGLGIMAEKGELVAPCDCTVGVVAETKHAVCLTFDSGVELLIHIGIDTVQLAGKCFEAFVKEGDRVKKGDKLVNFDIQGIKDAGYIPTVVITVPNTDDCESVKPVLPCNVKHGDTIIFVN